jgi:FdhD protein
VNSPAHERFPIRRFDGERIEAREDRVVVEEPLEIRVLGRPISVVMRTPGDDEDLAIGFVVTEGISPFDDISRAAPCVDARGEPARNVINVSLVEGASIDVEKFRRNLFVTSSCGVCGKATLDALRVLSAPIERRVAIPRDLFNTISERCRAQQSAFAATGGLHAACLLDARGNILFAREDVGRHNAVDKVAGALLRAGRFHAEDGILWISGRAGFEIIQKARVARISAVVSVGAPTSLAIECAREGNMTLVGFLRDGRFNVYCGDDPV